MTGQVKIVQYLLKDCHLIYKRDLNTVGGKSVHEMKHFFFVVMKKDIKVFEVLCQWLSLSREDIKELMWLLTQVKWTLGIETLLQSKLCHDMFV